MAIAQYRTLAHCWRLGLRSVPITFRLAIRWLNHFTISIRFTTPGVEHFPNSSATLFIPV